MKPGKIVGNDYAPIGAATMVAIFVGSRKKIGRFTEEFKQVIFKGKKFSKYKQKKSLINGHYITLINKQND